MDLASQQLIQQQLSPQMDEYLFSLFKAGLTTEQVKNALAKPPDDDIFKVLLPPPRPTCVYQNQYMKLRRFNPPTRQLSAYNQRVKAEKYLDPIDEKDTLQFLQATEGAVYSCPPWGCKCQETVLSSGVKLCVSDECTPYELTFMLPYQKTKVEQIIRQRQLARQQQSNENIDPDTDDAHDSGDELSSLRLLIREPQSPMDTSMTSYNLVNYFCFVYARSVI